MRQEDWQRHGMLSSVRVSTNEGLLTLGPKAVLYVRYGSHGVSTTVSSIVCLERIYLTMCMPVTRELLYILAVHITGAHVPIRPNVIGIQKRSARTRSMPLRLVLTSTTRVTLQV